MEKNYVSNKRETPRIFKSNLLEPLSRVHFTIPIILYVPVILYNLYKGVQVNTILVCLILFVGGILLWSFTEYIIHRFVFHYQPTSDIGKRIHFLTHGVHHDYPNDPLRLVMPPSISIPLAFLFYYFFKFMAGPTYVSPLFAGFVSGYLFYDISHYAIHHFNFHNKFWVTLKKHHMLHHYKYSDKGFGVSSSLWDKVFRTEFHQPNSDK